MSVVPNIEQVAIALIFDPGSLRIVGSPLGTKWHFGFEERSLCGAPGPQSLAYSDHIDTWRRMGTWRCRNCETKFEKAEWQAGSIMAKKGKSLA